MVVVLIKDGLWFDELPVDPMNVQQAYVDWAETYDSDRNLTRDLDQMVVRIVHVKTGRRALRASVDPGT